MASFDPYHKWLGIPPAEQPAHHYRLLGLSLFEFDADAIDAAAEQRTVYLRSFQTGPNAELAERLLNEVSEARVCLLDGKSKARYDQQLKGSQQPAQPVAKEIVPEETPAPLATPPRLPRRVASKPPSTRTPVSQRPADKPLWQQLWAILAAVGMAFGLLIMFMSSGGKAPVPSRTGTATAPENTSEKISLNEHDVNLEVGGMVLSLDQSEDINFKKQVEITQITKLLIRPHWEQIAAVKLAKRKTCYQLAVEHAEKLLKNDYSLQQHRKKRASTSKQPLPFDDQASREAENDYRDKYGKEFDTELAQLLDGS